jgi:hypothetical protein
MASSTSTRGIIQDSLEAIAYQPKSGLFRDLTLAFQRCVDEQIADQKTFLSLGLGDIVFRHTGLIVQFKLDPSQGAVNAQVMPVFLDPDSPLMQAYKRLGLGDLVDSITVTHDRILPLCRELTGSIDLGRSKVSGVFSKLPTDALLGSGLWLSAGLTAEEIAAVTIHEIGHVFTYFEALTTSVTTNVTLACAKRDINLMTDQVHRLELVYEVANYLKVKLDKPDSLADPALSDVTFQSVFLAAQGGDSVPSSAGSGTYDLRNSEVVADQFATRHGASRALAGGLFKIMRGSEADRSMAVHIISETIRLGVRIGIASINPAFTAIMGLSALAYLTFADPELKQYDDPRERLERIRSDLVQVLKTRRFDAKVRTTLLADIEVVESFAQQLHNHRTFFNWLWIWVGSNRRRQFRQMRFEQELEKMVNNDIFVKAAKLQSML